MLTRCLALLLICGAAAAQVPTGTNLRPMALGTLENTEARSFGDFLGRTVLIEFFAYW